MGIKIDKKAVKSLTARASVIDKFLYDAVNSERVELNELKKNANSFFKEKFKEELRAMDVDMLAQGKNGIRTGPLKNAGINNIYELSQLSLSRLNAISGIGDKSASKIHEQTRQIVKNAEEKFTPRISAYDPTPADDLLIKAAYVLICHGDARPKLKSIYDENHRPLARELEALRPASSGLKWLFSSEKTKTEAVSALDSLTVRLSGDFGDTALTDEWSAVTNASPEDYRAHFRENSAVYYPIFEKYCKGLSTAEKKAEGLSEELVAEVNAHPLDLKYLKATLRGYQTFGVKYALHQKRVLLGDEMGLGKTVQAIAVMAAAKAEGAHHFMVVCPASVLINWCREIEKFSTLSVTKIHGADEEALLHWRENGDVAVTTYESISRFQLPEKFTFDTLIVDEAHYVKNPAARRTIAMMSLAVKARGAVYMSGTPLVNDVDEMCFLVSCLQPSTAVHLEKVKALSTAEQFRRELSPVYLRRTREDVLKELPAITEKAQWCSLSMAEASMYKETLESGNIMAIRQVSWNAPTLNESSKAQMLLKICEDAEAQGRKLIVFSFFRNTLNKVCELLGYRCTPIISGDITPAERQEIVDEFNASDPGRVLVSQVQAGGTGLNIQSASVIVFCEPQLTPAIESQAIGRAYRMGQTRDVLVYRLLADDTIDERMLEILAGKQQQFDNFADISVIGTEQLESEIDSEKLSDIIKTEQTRVLGEVKS
ncbi:MAG: DEAD/DEAH box helicase [Clostridia bacterium]|nr:DEAD/DEAH box helicase [Clostridia bacterium]